MRLFNAIFGGLLTLGILSSLWGGAWLIAFLLMPLSPKHAGIMLCGLGASLGASLVTGWMLYRNSKPCLRTPRQD